jgi:hypothetical protein
VPYAKPGTGLGFSTSTTTIVPVRASQKENNQYDAQEPKEPAPDCHAHDEALPLPVRLISLTAVPDHLLPHYHQLGHRSLGLVLRPL